MKDRKHVRPQTEAKPKKDVLKDLGRFIDEHFKKGVDKVEQLFEDSKASDDKLFSYFKAFIDDKGVASVTPSSKFIVERVVKAMDVRGTKAVVEFGAASGPITKRILDELPADAKLIAIELNDELYARLCETIKDPRLIPVNGDVRQVKEICHKNGIEHVDVVVSGIPFAFLSGRGRHELLKDVHDLLKPGGRFVAYQVTTHLIGLLEEYFRKVKTQFEVRNIPPHFVFTAFK
jgi:phosphatidylethanolamine/phosphatidyl-N-methylethanolamine N-methyltransferase